MLLCDAQFLQFFLRHRQVFVERQQRIRISGSLCLLFLHQFPGVCHQRLQQFRPACIQNFRFFFVFPLVNLCFFQVRFQLCLFCFQLVDLILVAVLIDFQARPRVPGRFLSIGLRRQSGQFCRLDLCIKIINHVLQFFRSFVLRLRRLHLSIPLAVCVLIVHILTLQFQQCLVIIRQGLTAFFIGRVFLLVAFQLFVIFLHGQQIRPGFHIVAGGLPVLSQLLDVVVGCLQFRGHGLHFGSLGLDLLCLRLQTVYFLLAGNHVDPRPLHLAVLGHFFLGGSTPGGLRIGQSAPLLSRQRRPRRRLFRCRKAFDKIHYDFIAFSSEGLPLSAGGRITFL